MYAPSPTCPLFIIWYSQVLRMTEKVRAGRKKGEQVGGMPILEISDLSVADAESVHFNPKLNSFEATLRLAHRKLHVAIWFGAGRKPTWEVGTTDHSFMFNGSIGTDRYSYALHGLPTLLVKAERDEYCDGFVASAETHLGKVIIRYSNCSFSVFCGELLLKIGWL